MLKVLGKTITLLSDFKVPTSLIVSGFRATISFGINQQTRISFMEIGENMGGLIIAQVKNLVGVVMVAPTEEKICNIFTIDSTYNNII